MSRIFAFATWPIQNQNCPGAAVKPQPLNPPGPYPVVTVSSARQLLLIVDDEPDVLETLAEFVEVAFPGIEVETAPSGLDALESMQRRAPHAILCDYHMPGLDGIEVLRRSVELAPQARRALMTALSDASIPLQASARVPLDAFIEKATNPQKFSGLLASLMASRPAAPSKVA